MSSLPQVQSSGYFTDGISDCRRASSVSEMAAAVSQAAAAGVLATTSSDTADQAQSLDSTEQQASASTAVSTAEGSQGPVLEPKGSSQPQSEQLDPDQMAMRLALDVLWTGAGSSNPQQSSAEAHDDVAAS